MAHGFGEDMNGLLGMGPIGWIVSLVIGFIVGGILFLSMKIQVDYVLAKKGPLWVGPAAMYARMLLIAAALVVVAVAMKEQREKIPAAMISATAGTMIARVLIGRMVRRSADSDEEEKPSE